MIRVLVCLRRQPRAGRDALRLAAAVTGLAPDPGDPRVSVTHTERAGAAAVLVVGPGAGVGVDLEHDRPIREAMTRFYLRDDERGGDPLRLWTVKEAMFKADPDNGTRTLHDYRAADPAYRHVSARMGDGWLTVAVRLTRRPMTTRLITFEAVASRIATVLHIPESSLTPDTTLGDLTADSFMLVEMIVDLQEEFNAAFTQARLREVSNLGELVGLLRDTSV